MKTALILCTAFITTRSSSASREERIEQYTRGFKQIADLVRLHPEFDVFFADNTVEDPSTLDPRLTAALSQIPNLKKSLMFFDNENGLKNKGAGLATQWKNIVPLIPAEYEHVIHFEPRQRLENFTFFERFIKSPGTYFRISVDRVKKFRIYPFILVQIMTGMLAMKRSDMERYCNEVDIERMVRRRISIERDLYLFIQKNKIPFTKVDRLNLFWHDTANKKEVPL